MGHRGCQVGRDESESPGPLRPSAIVTHDGYAHQLLQASREERCRRGAPEESWPRPGCWRVQRTVDANAAPVRPGRERRERLRLVARDEVADGLGAALGLLAQD